jgi:hypothetical protein
VDTRRCACAVIPAILMALSFAACTGSPPPATGLTSPAPSLSNELYYSCGIASFNVGMQETDPGSLIEVLDGHVPSWLPSGMGLAQAYGPGGFTPGVLGGADLRDAACRQIRIRYGGSSGESHAGDTFAAWHVTMRSNRGCGESRDQTCPTIWYTARGDHSTLTVTTFGIQRPEADRIVNSIPL